MVVASALAAMPRTLAFGSGNERPTERQPEPRSSLTTMPPRAAAQMRCGRVASVSIVSTGASAPPKPASDQVRPHRGLSSPGRRSQPPECRRIPRSPPAPSSRSSAGARARPYRCGRRPRSRTAGLGRADRNDPSLARRRPLVPGPRKSGALARSQPSRSRRNTPFAAAQTTNWPSGEKTSANTAPMMRSRASGAQLRPPLRKLRIRDGADQQVERIASIDCDDKCRIEKQADIRIQPGGAEITGTKHAAIAARVMR